MKGDLLVEQRAGWKDVQLADYWVGVMARLSAAQMVQLSVDSKADEMAKRTAVPTGEMSAVLSENVKVAY